jgi:predicted component of type VI protein secretion system
VNDGSLDTVLSRLNDIVRRLDKIVQRLDRVIRVGAVGMTQGSSQTEQIWLFSLAGLQPREIADLLGTTPNTVRVALFHLRKSKRSKAGIGGLK